MKNTAQLQTLFALSNLWMARHRLLHRVPGWVRLQRAQGPGWGLERPRNRPPWRWNRSKRARQFHVARFMRSASSAAPVLNTILSRSSSPKDTR